MAVLRAAAAEVPQAECVSVLDDHAVVRLLGSGDPIEFASSPAAELPRWPFVLRQPVPPPPSAPAPAPGPAPGRTPPPAAPAPATDKAISGRFAQTSVKCGDPGHVEADGRNIGEGADTRFTVRRVDGRATVATVAGPMNAQSVRGLDWEPRRPRDWQRSEAFDFQVAADGVSAVSANRFRFHEFAAVPGETWSRRLSSPPYGWDGKFEISFADDVLTVTVKIKLNNRLGPKPADRADDPPIGPLVSARDKAAMKADIEGKLSRKFSLFRRGCRFGDDCSCPVPVVVVVSFVERGEHHVVDLYQGPGRANAGQWTRVKTRDNSWAHETGHLLGWFDEYVGGAVGAVPRWQPSAPGHVMGSGLTVPPEYGWDFRDWYAGQSGEAWSAR